jgi:hypothetical protein
MYGIQKQVDREFQSVATSCRCGFDLYIMDVAVLKLFGSSLQSLFSLFTITSRQSATTTHQLCSAISPQP